MGIKQLPSGSWRLQIRRKHLQFDNTYNTEEAARAAEKELLERLNGDGRALTLAQLWVRYAESAQFEEKKPKTQSTERGRIQPVLAKLGNYAITELEANTGVIYDYIDGRLKFISARTKRKLSPTSVRLEIAALSALVEFAKRRRIVRENFVSSISRPATKNRKRRVAPQEQGQLAIHARNSDPVIAQAARYLLLIRHLGCRAGELKDVAVKDVDLERSEITFWDTKNGEDRRAHITSEAATLLHLQLESVPEKSPYLFSTWSKYQRAWVPYNYSHGVNVLREMNVLPQDYHAHAGRREFVSRAIESNIPYATIKKQTGHRSTAALEIYDQGLSTAPEIRAILDNLAGIVKEEAFWGALEAAGITPEQKKQLRQKMGLDKPVDPFEAKRRALQQGS
jgi:integrase